MTQITINKAGPRYWQINYNGQRIDGFNRKREAEHVAKALSEVEDELGRLYDLMSGPITDERRGLTATINQVHVQALRTLP